MTIESVEAVIDLIELGAVATKDDIVKCLRSAIAESEKQEPVGFYDAENKDLRQEIPMGEDGDWWQPVYTRPQPKEPT